MYQELIHAATQFVVVLLLLVVGRLGCVVSNHIGVKFGVIVLSSSKYASINEVGLLI